MYNIIKMSKSDEESSTTNLKSISSIKLIRKEMQSDESNKITLDVTNEAMEYLNKLNSNNIGVISLVGPSKSEKTYFSNLIIGDKEAFDISKSTVGINMCRQPIAHGESTDLLVLDCEGFYKPNNANTSYDKKIFTLSCLLSSIMIYNTDETITDCVNKFTNLAKESLLSIKKIEGKDLTPFELPIVYFILHNTSIDSNSANQQFRNMVKDNPIFKNYFQNFRICILKKAGDLGKDSNSLPKAKTLAGFKIEDLGSLDDQDYKQKSKIIKEQIIKDLEPKKINNCNLDGKCLLGLFQSFVDSLNKGENIILFNQFNNVLELCLSDVEGQINFLLTPEKLNEKLKANISYEETYLNACKMTFKDLIKEQYDKFKSMPIVKISPSFNVINGINSIFIRCLTTLCENIQATVDEKEKIINETNKLEFTNKLEGYNIEKLLNGYTCFIYNTILSPIFEPNDKKFQNNDKILQVLKTKICGTIEKISPVIQGKINKLIEENNKQKKDMEDFRKKHIEEISLKTNKISELELKIEKIDRDIKEKDLENMTLINIEREKYTLLEEKYNLEINEKNARIKELSKNSNPLSLAQITTSNSAMQGDIQQLQLEALKNDYNDITNILVKYKILVNKLINDKEFFFEDILINKTLGDLRKKYPEIFDLLNEKESLENMKIYYDKQVERLRNENDNLKEKISAQVLEIEGLKKKIEEGNKIIEEKNRLYEGKQSNIQNLQTSFDNLENKIKEKDLLLKIRDRQISINDALMKEKDDTYLKKESLFSREIDTLNDVIEVLFTKNKQKFDNIIHNLSTQSQNKLNYLANNYKFKWG